MNARLDALRSEIAIKEAELIKTVNQEVKRMKLYYLLKIKLKGLRVNCKLKLMI